MSQITMAILFPNKPIFVQSTADEIATALVKDYPAEVWHIMQTVVQPRRFIAVPVATDEEKKRGDTQSCKRRAVMQVRDNTPIPGMRIISL
jgi:hypothetical protein